MRSVRTSIVLSLLLFAAPARAEEAKAQARKHFRTGMAAFTVERYDDAIREFEEGFLLEPDPVFLFNIGQAYRLSNRPERAIASYKKYLQLKPSAPNRADVEDHIAELTRQTNESKRPPRDVMEAPADPDADANANDKSEAVPATKPQRRPPQAEPDAEPTPAAQADRAEARAAAHVEEERAPLVRASAETSSETKRQGSKRSWPIWVGVAAGVVAVAVGASLGAAYMLRGTERSAVADVRMGAP